MRGSRLFCGYAFRRALTESAPMLLVGVPSDGCQPRVLYRPPPNECDLDVHVDPSMCLDFSMTLVVPAQELFWPVVPPREFLDHVCAKASALADGLLSERVTRSSVITPLLLFPKNAFLPGYWERPLVSGRYMPVFAPTESERAFVTARNLDYPFTIDLELRRNNFWVGVGVGFLPNSGLSEKECRLAKLCVHRILTDLIAGLDRVTIFPVTLSGEDDVPALMGLTSDAKGLRVYVKETYPALADKNRRNRVRSDLAPPQSMMM